ncbi:filamentous hemagglutinin N-terminal domain-containing protein [Caenimonas sedimenti]|uniref:two-partner secretion domain-containing protein n=1 Tax=Caenimonas sedimenti TaxID=2596921 RepID=UPI0016483344|nr:filamentous hemagglutinin N-terminal domain-containing protein [Caenimonas sedimenti]
MLSPVLALLSPVLAGAQVRTDGSLGGAARSLAGPTYAITESLGQRAGNNLFHSFQTFRIGAGETALFSTSTPTIANVFGRVTGGAVSTIDGTIRLQAAAGAPALFLINPAGVVFGAGSAIDVPGAFHVSTADSIRFADGVFHAGLARASTFSAAPPEAFGFLGEQRAAVVLRGAQLANGDAPVAIVAGDVMLQDGASVSNRAGPLRLVAVGRQAMQVPLDGEPGPLQGTLRIEPGGIVQTVSRDAAAGGAIQVAAGRVEVAGPADPDAPGTTGIVSSADAAGPGGAVWVRADDALVLSRGAAIESIAWGEGAGGPVHVSAGSLLIDSQGDFFTRIQSKSFFGGGPAGDVGVDVRGNARIAGARPLEDGFAWWQSGDGRITAGQAFIGSMAYVSSSGAVKVNAGRLRLENGAALGTEAGSSGQAGSIAIQAGNLTLAGGGIYTVNTGDANGGGITVSAAEQLHLGENSILVTTSVGAGRGGDIAVRAKEVEIRNSVIQTAAYDTGRGGDVTLDLEGRLHVANDVPGTWSGIFATAEESPLLGLQGETSGRIGIRAGQLSMEGVGGDDGDNRQSTLTGIATSTYGNTAGNIGIEVAGAASLRNATIRSRGQFGGSTGSIRLRAGGAVLLEDTSMETDSQLVSETFVGLAGDIDVEAPALHLVGREWSSYITTSGVTDQGTGGAGTIRLRVAGPMTVQGGGGVSSITTSLGLMDRSGGSGGPVGVDIRAGSLLLDALDADTVTQIASRVPSGSGGVARDLLLKVDGPIELRHGAFMTTTTMGIGNAGTLSIEAGSLLIDNNGSGRLGGVSSESLAWAGGFITGDAGDISVRLRGDLEVRAGGRISSSSVQGAAGTVRVEAANVLLTGGYTGPPIECLICPDSAYRSSIAAFILPLGTQRIPASGQGGNVSITASGRIRVEDGAQITIRNDAIVGGDAPARGLLQLAAPLIELRGNNATISAASTGNVGAGDIQIDAGRAVVIQDSRIVTSAVGTAGDGGFIRVNAPVMALSTGFVQANAIASSAAGGDIAVNVRALLSSHESLHVGGDSVAVFEAGRAGGNVIQAVAPTGVSGNIQIASPQLDLAGTLTLVTAGTLPNEPLGKSPCRRTGGSALGLAGRGGLAPSAMDPVGSQLGQWASAPAGASVVRLAGRAGCVGS